MSLDVPQLDGCMLLSLLLPLPPRYAPLAAPASLPLQPQRGGAAAKVKGGIMSKIEIAPLQPSQVARPEAVPPGLGVSNGQASTRPLPPIPAFPHAGGKGQKLGAVR